MPVLTANGLHSAAFRAAWATCDGWRDGDEDPSAELFFAPLPTDDDAGLSVSASAPLEPLLLLPPRARDADEAALQVRARRRWRVYCSGSHPEWPDCRSWRHGGPARLRLRSRRSSSALPPRRRRQLRSSTASGT